MYFDRYDIVDAWYWYLSFTHEGQGSKKYERLCKLMKRYTPGLMAVGPATENAGAILKSLYAKDME